MSDFDIASLRKIADAATPGPWYADDYEGISTSPVQHEAEWTIVDTEGCGTARPGDHDFIATFNPATVLALLDRLERAEARVKHLEADAALDTEGNRHLYDDLKKAEAAIERVRAVHQPQPGEGARYCADCDQKWPCPTIAALGTEDE